MATKTSIPRTQQETIIALDRASKDFLHYYGHEYANTEFIAGFLGASRDITRKRLERLRAAGFAIRRKKGNVYGWRPSAKAWKVIA